MFSDIPAGDGKLANLFYSVGGVERKEEWKGRRRRSGRRSSLECIGEEQEERKSKVKEEWKWKEG